MQIDGRKSHVPTYMAAVLHGVMVDIAALLAMCLCMYPCVCVCVCLVGVRLILVEWCCLFEELWQIGFECGHDFVRPLLLNGRTDE